MKWQGRAKTERLERKGKWEEEGRLYDREREKGRGHWMERLTE